MKLERQDLENDCRLSSFRANRPKSLAARATLYLIVLLLGGGFAIDYWFNYSQQPLKSSGDTTPHTLP